MMLKEEEQKIIDVLRAKAKDEKDNTQYYLSSIAESLAIIAHKLGRKLP